MPRPSRKTGRRRSVAASTASLLLALPAAVSAAELTFNGGSSDWFDPTNWSGGTVPGAGDTAIVDGVTEALIFGESASAGTLLVGNANDGSLLIRDPLATGATTIGAGAGADGLVTASGILGQWTNGGDLIVGAAGTGTLDVIEAATVDVGGNFFLGAQASGSGVLLADGGGTRIDIGGTLHAGHAGSGAVSISAGAWLVSGGARFGTLTGSAATLDVDGDGSLFRTGSLVLGDAGQATLTLANNGAVDVTGDATLGLSAGGSGTLSIDGGGSLLTVGGTLHAGQSGNGAVSISGGGRLVSGAARFGTLTGSTASLDVDGDGSLFRTGDLILGDAGQAALTLANNGAVEATDDATLGLSAGGSGSADIAGEDSLFSVGGQLAVGMAGDGTLTLREGGKAASGSAVIGGAAGGTGTAALSGLGTEWTVYGHLGLGTGTLAIDTAAALATGSATIGTLSGETASATLDGDGSLWANGGLLAVGGSGDGSLSIRTGADVTTGEAVTGLESGASGAIHVDGDGSSLAVAGAFDIGRFGDGSLTVSGGASVSAGSITIAAEAGSTGVLNIGAPESELAAGAGTLDTAGIRFGDGAASLVLNHGETDYELAAALSGTGTVKVLRGTTILTGDNSHDGETIISSGATLAIGNGGDTGTAGNGDIANDGALIFDRSGELAYGGAISGSGTLAKRGDGTLTLSGDSLYGGATAVEAGTLLVDGSLASAVTVEDGARLGGSGSVGAATLETGATLSSGGLAIDGDLTFAAGSLYDVTIGANGIDGVTVGGTATLGGADLALAYESGGLLANHYTILEAGTLSGDFASLSVSGLSPRFSVTETADGSAVDLALSYDASAAALSGRGAQGAHAALADAFNGGTALSGSLGAALASDGPAFQNAMTALSGETGTSARMMSVLAMENFLFSTGTPARGSTLPEDGDGFWARLDGGTHDFDGRTGVQPARITLSGLTGGARFELSPDWSAGVALNGGYARYAPDGIDASAKGLYGQVAIDALGQFENGFYLSSALGLGLTAIDTKRTLGAGSGSDRVEGDFTARTAGALLEAGRRLDFGAFSLTPFAGATLIYAHAPGYRETAVSGTGNPALAYSATDAWNGSAFLGTTFGYDAAIGGRVAHLRTRLAYIHRFADDGNPQARFVSLPGGAFGLDSLQRDGGAVSVSVGADIPLSPAATLALDFGGEWGSDHRSLSGKAALNLRW